MPARPDTAARFALRLAFRFACFYAPLFFLFGNPVYFKALAALFSFELRLVEPDVRSVAFVYTDNGPQMYHLGYRVEVAREFPTPDGFQKGTVTLEGSIRGVIMFLNPVCLFALILAWPRVAFKRRAQALCLGMGLLLVVFSVYVVLFILSKGFFEGSLARTVSGASLSMLEAGGVKVLILLADAAAFLFCVRAHFGTLVGQCRAP